MKQSHKKFGKCLFLTAIVMLFIGMTTVQAQENILGDWVFTMSMADSGMGTGPMEFIINSTITKDADGKYAMTWEQQEQENADAMGGMGGFAMPQVKNEDIKLDGNKLTFNHIASFGDMGGMGAGGGDMIFAFAGTIEGDAIKGTLASADDSMGMGATEMAISAKRVSKAPAATVSSAKGLEGKWNFKMVMADSGMGTGAMEFDVKSTITKDAQGNYAMTWDQTMSGGADMGGMGGGGAMTFNVTVSDIKLDGKKLTFNRTVDMGDMGGGMGGGGAMTSTFTGTFEGDKIEGTISGDYGELTLTGSREASGAVPAAATGLVGAWEFVTTFGDMGMEFKADATFTKAADGKYSCTWKSQPMEGGMGGQGGGMPEITITISDIKLDGEKLTFVQNVDMGGMGGMISNFSGTLKGDKIEGALASEMGESKSVATRKKGAVTTPAAGGDALTGNWELTMNMGDMGMGMAMEFNIKSTITKDAAGKYAMTWEQTMSGGDMGGMGGGMPQPAVTISDIKLDGEKLTFTQKVSFGDMGGGMGGPDGGMEMTSKFTGTVKNNVMEGKMVGEDNGMGMGAMEFTVKGSKK
ncbi:MAG: hypothetical protein JXA96_09060 [Sedimentisphaerales bacterium]|nr:hypothetical protein [Sedimentisphaerales bacterium]